jgi:enoyl-CoA hydratase
MGMVVLKNIELKLAGNILTIIINRPEKMNALNLETLKEIGISIKRAYDEPEIKGVILTGAGDKAFVAGADISEIAGVTETKAKEICESGQAIFKMIEDCPKPVIAAVNGFALGGGCELVLACHIRIASENAKFGLPEVTLGIIPGYGGTQRLPQLIGKGKAFELILTGEMIGAAEAFELGLVNHLVTQIELLPMASEILKKIMQRAPFAITQAIKCINLAGTGAEGFQAEANSFSQCCKTTDFKEGTSAFLEKRKANFTGK